MPDPSANRRFQFGSSAILGRRFVRCWRSGVRVRHFGNTVVFLTLLVGLTACPAPQPTSSKKNKFQEYQERLWRKAGSDAPRPQTGPSPRKESSSLNVEDAPLPFEIAEKVAAELDIACGGEHPPLDGIVKADPVQITPEGGKAMIVTVHHSCICSPTGNCPHEVWIADKDNHYSQALTDEAYGLLLGTAVHNGGYDVITEAYLTATESSIVRYEWDGKRYGPAEQSCRVGEGEIGTRKIVSGKCR